VWLRDRDGATSTGTIGDELYKSKRDTDKKSNNAQSQYRFNIVTERCAQLTSEPFSFVDAKCTPVDGPVFRCNSSTWTGPYY
jgi:hypothetical protein